MAHFCNRLCLAKAQSSAHHPLLCPGQNKGALDLLQHIHRHGARHLDATAKILAKIRSEKDGATAKRVWEGMARINIEKKESEMKEWYVVLRFALTKGNFWASKGAKNGGQPTTC